jgi:hypothetical protein
VLDEESSTERSVIRVPDGEEMLNETPPKVQQQ